MIDATKLVDFLSQLKITANQYLFCHLLYTKEFDTLRKYVTSSYTIKEKEYDLRFTEEEIKDLVDRGYVVKLFNKNSPSSYMVTDKFSRKLFIEIDEAGEQLWDTYPKTLKIDGIIQSTRTCDKEEVLELYAKRIKFSLEKHKEIMILLNKYKVLVKDGRMNGMGIEKWIKGENWDVVKEVSLNENSWNELI